MVKTQDVIELAGGMPQLMILLDIKSTQAIYHWGNTVPQARVYELRVKRPEWFSAKGELKPRREGPGKPPGDRPSGKRGAK